MTGGTIAFACARTAEAFGFDTGRDTMRKRQRSLSANDAPATRRNVVKGRQRASRRVVALPSPKQTLHCLPVYRVALAGWRALDRPLLAHRAVKLSGSFLIADY